MTSASRLRVSLARGPSVAHTGSVGGGVGGGSGWCVAASSSAMTVSRSSTRASASRSNASTSSHNALSFMDATAAESSAHSLRILAAVPAAVSGRWGCPPCVCACATVPAGGAAQDASDVDIGGKGPAMTHRNPVSSLPSPSVTVAFSIVQSSAAPCPWFSSPPAASSPTSGEIGASTLLTYPSG